MSDTYYVAILLALVGGYLDAYTYLCRGQVFANAQTGNIVYLGIKAAAGEWHAMLYYLFPILAFFAGILFAEMIKRHFRFHPKIHWRQIIILIEFLTLAAVAFIPQGEFNMAANIMISFVCSLQVESFRKVNDIPYATTMCTGNLRSATEHLYLYHQTKDKTALKNSLQYYGVILFFIAGAGLGALLTGQWQEKSVLVSGGILFFVFLMMFIKEDIEI